MIDLRMNLWQTQMAIFNKTSIAFELWLENPLPNVTAEEVLAKNKEQQREYLKYDVKVESYRMMVVNYLSVLLGTRQNDKISIYNNHPKGKEELIQKFYDSNKDFVNKLATMRDKVYSHFDLDYIETCKTISFEEIYSAIEFLSKIIKE